MHPVGFIVDLKRVTYDDHGSDRKFVPSPLIGPNIEEFGERFPDMSHIYDEELQEVIRKCGSSADRS